MVAEHVKVDIERFIGYVELGIDFFEKAGEELVRLKKNDPDIFEAITSEHKWMTKDMLLVFENIGLKKIHPMTLLMPNHVFAKLSEMPYEQQKYLAEGMEVEVVSSSDLRNGYHQNGVRKLLSELTKPEAELVLSRNGVRTPKEQVEVEAKKASTIDFRDPGPGQKRNAKPMTDNEKSLQELAAETAEKIVHLFGVGHGRDIDHWILAALKQSQEPLRKDKERLDWLDQNRCVLSHDGDSRMLYIESLDDGSATEYTRDNTRDAIDAAISNERQNETKG